MIYRGVFLFLSLVWPFESHACQPVDFNRTRYTSALSFKGRIVDIQRSTSFIDERSKAPFLRAEVEVTEIFKGSPGRKIFVREITEEQNSICPCTVGYLVDAQKSQRLLEFHLFTDEPEPFVCEFFQVM